MYNQIKWKTKNEKWEIIEVISNRIPNHRRGWLINVKTGIKYVWSMGESGKVRYMKEYIPPRNIPIFIDEEIKNARHERNRDR